MQTGNKLFVLTGIVASTVGCDQATKKLASFALKDIPPMSFWGNVFRLEYSENNGAFLGMGATLPDLWRFLLLTLFSSLLLGAMTLYVFLKKSMNPVEVWGYALILAGGLSNMIDRIAQGFVVDFLNVGLGSLRTGIFNVADMVIMAGLFLLIAAQWQSTRAPATPAVNSP